MPNPIRKSHQGKSLAVQIVEEAVIAGVAVKSLGVRAVTLTVITHDDEDDIEEWDTILEISLPHEMAMMLDFTQHSYYTMQSYFSAQWAIMQKVLEEDEPEYPDEVSGDNVTFDKLFEGIVKSNNLDEIAKEEE